MSEESLSVSFRNHVERLFVKPGTLEGRVMHAAVGIAGEVGELLDCLKKTWIYGKPLDYPNLREEIGDVMFYAEALCLQMKRPCGFDSVLLPSCSDCSVERMVSLSSQLFKHSGELLGRSEAFWAGQDGIGFPHLSFCLDRVVKSLVAFQQLSGFTLDECRLHNMEKLALRYPDGYTDQSAIARADKAGES
jgi:hypothetical protein